MPGAWPLFLKTRVPAMNETKLKHCLEDAGVPKDLLDRAVAAGMTWGEILRTLVQHDRLLAVKLLRAMLKTLGG